MLTNSNYRLSYLGSAFLGALLVISMPAKAQKPGLTYSISQNKPESLTIQDIQDTKAGRLIVLKSPRQKSVVAGTYLNVKRPGALLGPSFQGADVPVGVLQAVSSFGNQLMAAIVSEGTEQSQYYFPDYPGIMVGDLVQIRELHIQPRQNLAPNRSLSYFDLFVDPRRDPTSFELSDQGRQRLRELANEFGSLRVPLLLIKGHTDHRGASNANQIESYQRALTVSQFLIEELGFDRSRLVALGLGESEPLAEPYLPDYERRARRIELKVKSTDIHAF